MSKKHIYLVSFVLMLGLATGMTRADPYQQEAGPDGIVSIEAENFDDNIPKPPHTWDLITESASGFAPPDGFSGGAAMQSMPADPGGGDNFNAPSDYLANSPRLDYEVNFAKTGTHYVWVLAWGQDGNSDSLHSGLDGEAIATADRISAFNNNYTWSNAPYEDPERVSFEVTSAGVHTVNIWMREDGAVIDKILLTTNPDYTPTDAGPEESPRGPRFKAYGPIPEDGELYADTWASLSWAAGNFAVSHDVYFGDNFDDVNNGAAETFLGNQVTTILVVGFPGFPYPDGLVPGTTYYWRIDEVNDTEPNSPWKGDVWSFSIPPKTAYYPDPANGAEQVDLDVELSWTPGFGAKLHHMYFGDNFADVNNGTPDTYKGPVGLSKYTPGTLELAKTYHWRVDEFDAVETHKGHVWSFTTEGAVGNPNPANGAVDVKQTQILTWTPGVYADSHEIYFGTDKEAARNADTGSPEYKGTGNLGSENYDPGKLEWNATYYWRIDEANNTNPDSPWTGNVWSFTTANFLIVDDFESYNDLDPADPDSNRIFNAWLDGYDDPTNGSLVGYDTPPFAEQTIVHGGNQSIPLFYDNSIGYSEATLTLTYPRDWTENGVDTLTIWFRGNSDNAAETLYVALNGNAIVTNDNPDAAQVTIWMEWTIDLQAFADQGVNLADVNTISLGLGNRNNPVAGGSGTMYFDDIRLYPPPEPVP